MGLAASQGRLLLLTARKSDLEFRAQQISQARLVLARDQEGVAKKYADATSNTCLKMTINENNSTKELDFTAGNFAKAYYNQNGTTKGDYQLTDKNGTPIKIQYDANGNVTSITGGNLTTAQRDALKADTGGAESSLKFLIETGVIKLQKKSAEKNANGTDKWEDASIAGETLFRETLYDVDDKKAETEYNAAMLRIKVKDQQLELDLKGIETQHKAVETEYESVQKVIQKNIEVSFKIFS